jgi:hypothetical protein
MECFISPYKVAQFFSGILMGCYKALEITMYMQFKARLRVFWSTSTNIKKAVYKADFRLAVTIDCIVSSHLGLTLC